VLEPLAHLLEVCARPVDSLAAGAALELGLRPQYVGRHTIGDLAGRDGFQRGITHGTAREGGVGRRAERGPYLLHLLLQRLCLDQQRAQAAALGQFPVAGEQYAALRACAARQFCIGGRVVVGDIVTQQPQPPGQPAQHSVGQKSQVLVTHYDLAKTLESGKIDVGSDVPFYSKGTVMAIETWLPALLGYFIPVGLFLLAWGGMAPERARRTATVGALALALAVLGYWAVGFAFHLGGASVAMGEQAKLYAQADGWGLIGLSGFFLAGKATAPQALALFANYLPLVASAVLLVVLSVAGRARGWQVVLGGLAVGALLFPLAACWAWGGGWLANLGVTIGGGSSGHGFVDHAGSGMVYLLGGLAALGALVGLGKRLPRGEPDKPAEMPPVHFPLLANLGALLFGLGWLGWSLSKPFHVTGATLNPPLIAVNGLLAAAGAILASQTYCWLTVGHADALMSARGAVAGFVAISAGAPFVPPWAALLTGIAAGLLLPPGVYLVERVLRLPDETATVALGITAGLLGLLVVALFANGLWGQGWNGIPGDYRGASDQGVTGFFAAARFDRGDGSGQLIDQLAGIGSIGALAFLTGWLVFLVLSAPYRLRGGRQTP
jgi:Amt family ammonium transporter